MTNELPYILDFYDIRADKMIEEVENSLKK